ncbi:hypothetical protein [Lysobacter humi (ex Lee et al. 2017)]
MSRSIHPQEAAVIKAALAAAPTAACTPEIVASVPNLRVTAGCECGCATVWFGPAGAASTGSIVADARATAGTQDIDVIVWASEQEIVGLELVGEGAVPLPEPATVRQQSVA